MKKMMYQSMALVLFVFSFAQVNLASGVMGYQPRLPESLKR